jgi:hypothetical protein
MSASASLHVSGFDPTTDCRVLCKLLRGLYPDPAKVYDMKIHTGYAATCDSAVLRLPHLQLYPMMCALMDCDAPGFRRLHVNIKLDPQVYKTQCVNLRVKNVNVATKRSALYTRIGERLGGNMPVKLHLDGEPDANGTLSGWVQLHDCNGHGVDKLAERLTPLLLDHTAVRFFSSCPLRPEGVARALPKEEEEEAPPFPVSQEPQPPNAVVPFVPPKEEEVEELPPLQLIEASHAPSEWDVPTGDLAVIDKLKEVQLIIQQFEEHLAKLREFKQRLTTALVCGGR